MGYFSAKRDLSFMQRFRERVFALLTIEGRARENVHGFLVGGIEIQEAVQSEASDDPAYQEARQEVATGVHRAMSVAARVGVPLEIKSIPPMAVGGAVLPINIFYAVLHDTSHGGLSPQWIVDKLNEVLGECEERVHKELLRLINPFYLVVEIVAFVIRIPFVIFAAAGFDIDRIEEHLVTKLFKVAEVVLLVYMLVRLGISPEVMKSVFGKLFGGGE